jgi:hypothetical protein
MLPSPDSTSPTHSLADLQAKIRIGHGRRTVVVSFKRDESLRKGLSETTHEED